MESSRRHLWQIWRPKSLKSILSRNLGCSEERQHDFSVVTSSRNMSLQAWSKRYAQYVQSTVCDAVSFFAFGETTFGEPREHKPFLENFLFVLTWLQSLKTFLAEINPGWLNRLQDGSRSTEAHSYGKNLRWQECGEGVLFWWTASTCSNLCYALNYFTVFYSEVTTEDCPNEHQQETMLFFWPLAETAGLWIRSSQHVSGCGHQRGRIRCCHGCQGRMPEDDIMWIADDWKSWETFMVHCPSSNIGPSIHSACILFYWIHHLALK